MRRQSSPNEMQSLPRRMDRLKLDGAVCQRETLHCCPWCHLSLCQSLPQPLWSPLQAQGLRHPKPSPTLDPCFPPLASWPLIPHFPLFLFHSLFQLFCLWISASLSLCFCLNCLKFSLHFTHTSLNNKPLLPGQFVCALVKPQTKQNKKNPKIQRLGLFTKPINLKANVIT